MHIAKYVPKDCLGEAATLEGYVELVVPTIEQRYEYLDQCGIELDDTGSVVGGSKNNLKIIRYLGGVSKKHYHYVALKIKADGTEIKSYDDLTIYPECQGVYSEVATMLLNGFRPEKKL